MDNYLKENEEYKVHAFCKECNKKFEVRALKKDVTNVKCGLCEGSNIDIISSNPVRQILME